MNNKRIFIAIAVAVVLAGGFLVASLTSSNEPDVIPETQSIIKFDDQDDQPVKDVVKEEPRLTLVEVAKHDTRADCWMVIRGKVYDVSVSRFQDHPGGEAIFQGCGIDSTVLFETRPMGTGTPHSALSIEKILPTFYIGDLVK